MNQRIVSRPAKARGFTLIELMVVVAILAILAGVVISKLDLSGKTNEAMVVKAKHDIGTIVSALEFYHLDKHEYPTTDQGLDVLLKSSDGKKYLKQKLVDPWGNDYQYIAASEASGEFKVFSYGIDKVQSDDDVGNWNLD